MTTDTLTRRRFASASFLGLTSIAGARRAAAAKHPRILLRGSWQSVNIGDVGHTPGALDLLAQYFPEARVTLWPGKLDRDARKLLTDAYPELTIAEGALDSGRKPNSPALARAWEEADLYLSGSGSGFPASDHAAAFRAATGKPVGVFGVSADPISGIGEGRDPEGGTLDRLRARAMDLPPNHLPAALRDLIDHCAFFFCRDTISRDYLKSQRVKTPVLEFGPDAQLGMKLRNEAKGLAWMKAHDLEPGKFVCVVPRMRYTPYYLVNKTSRAAADDIKDAINDRTTEKDMAKLRALITAYVRSTGNKVVACPEMTYQIELARKVLVEPLPESVRTRVVWRQDFWMPDEAASLYAHASAVVSAECHSPLIAYRNGTPAIYLRQPTDTCKGQMYRDLGAGAWLFEVDETSGDQLWSRLESIIRDPNAARTRVRTIMEKAEAGQKQMVTAVRSACAG